MEFNIVERLLGITLLGTEWVLWLLIVLSVVSVAIMIERAIYFSRLRFDFQDFSNKLTSYLGDNDYDKAIDLCKTFEAPEAKMALHGLKNRDKGSHAMEGSMEGFVVGQRHLLDRGLVVLGTLGNNAPFIGLFGTVVGIIMAFNDLANNPAGGPSVVMAGISEALVATAVGLMVAIPAVIAFNGFNRVVKRKMANAQAIIKIIMTYQQKNA
jgi:biopolymer transport protein ExbB